ncbi:MAG: sugar phosphate isomerase/epimerase [Alphaproteobacteria bacterium]|nr:sugar phosphate isomerase/epimerase [Alphaproteobacteria bacterium]
MKIGMNLLLWASSVTPAHFSLFDKLKATGFDGIEVPVFSGDAAQYYAIRQAADGCGLACTAVTIATPEANPISADAAVRRAALDRIRWATEMAAILNSPILCGPFHSPLGIFSGSGATADEKKRGADVLRDAAEFAGKSGLTLALEYLNRFECYFLTTAADARALVEHVDHPHCRAMYDTFHANIEEKHPAETIRDFAGHFVHVHISENDRGTPGTGHVQWVETFRALRETGYDGWLTIEAFGRALPELAAATRVWRDFFSSPEEVYTQGFRFIRQQWDAAR